MTLYFVKTRTHTEDAMWRKIGRVLVVVFFVSAAALIVTSFGRLNAQAGTQIKAFPGAEGFGSDTVGGRGGKVYVVSNLNDSGAGSLRECVAASGARTCVFKVGGTITLSSSLSISNPYITIAGQTAPGGGITLKSSGSDIFSPKTHDIVIRYITGRPGVGGENHAVQIASNNSTSIYNIVFDHCSFSWGIDSVWETWYRVYDTTIQWSFVNEGLDCSTHSKGCHSKGLMIGGYKVGESSNAIGSYNISVHHNLMAHDAERAPLMQFCGNGQVINNVTYNPMWTFSHQEINCADPAAVSTVNWIGNYHKKGPDSTSNTDYKVSVTGGTSTGRAYFQGNIGPGRSSNSLPETNGVSANASLLVTTPVSAPAVTTTDALTAYNQVLAEGGNSKGVDCSGKWFSRRDSIDARVVNEVKTGTGHIIDDPSEVGGWVTIDQGTACADSDHDGMPDAYETANGLNLSVDDTNQDKDGDGYTNIEEYMNGTGTGSGSSPAPTAAPTVAPTPIPTPISGLTRPMKYYGVDRVRDNADFAKLAAWGINTAVVNLYTSGTVSQWQSVYNAANAAGIKIVIWPNIGSDNACGWESPFNNPVSGSYIESVKPLLDYWKDKAIGIVIAHEPMWHNCNDKWKDMTAVHQQIDAYTGSSLKIWNYIDNLSDIPQITDYNGQPYTDIMDVAATWQHCAGNAESTCDSPTDSYSALNKIKKDRSLINNAGLNGKVELVFLQDTFTAGGSYSVKFTLDQLQNYSCEFLNTSALDGFMYYTWDEGWYTGNLKKWTDLQPGVKTIYDSCINKGTGTTAPAPTATPQVKLGDANGDGKVDEADFTVWFSHYGLALSGVSNGDFNSDGLVDGIDYAIWLTNHGK